MKPFSERYTQEEYDLIESVIKTLRITRNTRFSGNYQPYQIKADLPSGQLGYEAKINGKNVSVAMVVKSAKLDFAIQVWEIAQDLTKSEFHDYLHHEWLTHEDPIKQLTFKSQNRAKAGQYFQKLLIEICKDEKISVNERAVFRRREDHNYPVCDLNLEICVDVENLTNQVADRLREQFAKDKNHYPLNKTGLRFSYEEIKDYFFYLNTHLLSLLNARDGLKSPTKIERQLFKHAEKFNLEGILEALEKGADINALDTNGETALAKLIFASRYDDMVIRDEEHHEELRREIPDYTDDEKMKVIQTLLDHGADINFYGYDGINALQYASYAQNPVLLKFLLDRGADPNLNYFPEDQTPIISHPLDNILGDFNNHNSKEDEERLEECERVLLASGAK